MTALLHLDTIHVAYSGAIMALAGLSLRVEAGEIVALLGANGAGKSTTLRAISNLLPAQRGKVTHGRVLLDGQDVTHRSAARIVRAGVVQVLEGRHCFRTLTIEENLLTGAASVRSGRAQTARDLDRVYSLFACLREKRRLPAGLASGGEQQMVAIGRALMSRPRLLVLDEPSMGLAPLITAEIFEVLRRLNAEEGVAMLVAEQNAAVALRIAHRALVIEHGAVVLADDAAALRTHDRLQRIYFGLDTAAASRRQAVSPTH